MTDTHATTVPAPAPRPGASGEAATPVLSVRDLRTQFNMREGVVRAVDGLSFDLFRGQTLGVVGESGCGKSVAALSVLRLIADPPGHIVGGSVRFGGRDLLTVSERDMQDLRGAEIAMIFQEPMTALNPVLTVGQQIAEMAVRHEGMSRREARARALEMLKRVRIPEPERRLDEYPHQLSGGMRQRVMIAMALTCNPQVLIADEPTTALDVTIQAQILDLMRELQTDTGAAVLLITHDLGVVAGMAQRVVVMYAGKKVEEAEVADLFARPGHPYTQGLLASMPRLNRDDPGGDEARLTEIQGMVPPLHDLPPGCHFAPRCAYAVERCRREEPPLEALAPGHWAACWESARLFGGRP